MKYDKTITTKHDIKKFFKWLTDQGINFHPDDEFEDEYAPLNKSMDECWEVADRNRIDIYNLGLTAILNAIN